MRTSYGYNSGKDIMPLMMNFTEPTAIEIAEPVASTKFTEPEELNESPAESTEEAVEEEPKEEKPIEKEKSTAKKTVKKSAQKKTAKKAKPEKKEPTLEETVRECLKNYPIEEKHLLNIYHTGLIPTIYKENKQ